MRGLFAVARARAWVLLAGFAIASSHGAAAQQNRGFGVEYVVEVKDTQAQLFHVTARFENVDQPKLDLALPVWTPGWYTLEYYAKNVSHFVVTDGQGHRLSAPLVRPQTWTVDTRNVTRVVAEFDYHATVVGLNQAYVGSEYAFFTGTQLFLEPVGHRQTAPTVRFVVRSGWRIASALRETNDPQVYRATDYDALVDAPTWLGAFQLVAFEVEGKPYSIVFDSRAQVPTDKGVAWMERYFSILRAQSAIFGGLPYDKFVAFCLPGDTGDAVEHLNSFVAIGTPDFRAPPTELAAIGSGHEHFHVWNVKRIRPAEMWPYDYSGPNETPSLWMSEGVTDYYAALSAYRAGVASEAVFLRWLSLEIGDWESNDERGNVSPSDASRATWRHYLSEPVSYYSSGAVLGALLDLSIVHDTRGARGLDDVMRVLLRDFYGRSKGFTATDLVHVVSSVAGRDYSDFFRRYVTGTETPPYETILASAGLRASARTVTLGVLEVTLGETVGTGRRIAGVRLNSAAANAGLRKDDVLVAVGGEPLPAPNVSLGEWLGTKAGTHVAFSVIRGGEMIDVPINLRTKRLIRYTVDIVAEPTPEQMVVRSRWLAKS